MRRWLTPAQLGDQLAQRSPRVAKLNPKRRREYAVRVVQRIEKLEERTLTKRAPNGRILVSWRAVEVLNPPDIASIDLIDQSVSELSHKVRALTDRTGAHGSHLRDHARRITAHAERISILEEKEAARREFEAKIQEIESRKRAAG